MMSREAGRVRERANRCVALNSLLVLSSSTDVREQVVHGNVTTVRLGAAHVSQA